MGYIACGGKESGKSYPICLFPLETSVTFALLTNALCDPIGGVTCMGSHHLSLRISVGLTSADDIADLRKR